MKLISDFGSFANWPSNLHAAGIALALALPLLCGSCSRKNGTTDNSATAPSTAPESTATAPSTSAQAVASALAPATTTNATPDLRPLNHALLVWIVRNRRHPASFEEFSASAGIQIPPPPAGKKYIIDHNGLIGLVNR